MTTDLLSGWAIAISLALHLAVFLSLTPSPVANHRPTTLEVSYLPQFSGSPARPSPSRSHKMPKLTAGSKPVPAPVGVEQDAVARYAEQLAALLNSKKRFPDMARRLGQQGRVVVQFKLARDGRVLSAEILTPAPFESLNTAARSLIDEIKGLKPFHDEVRALTWTFTVPIEYRM